MIAARIPASHNVVLVTTMSLGVHCTDLTFCALMEEGHGHLKGLGRLGAQRLTVPIWNVAIAIWGERRGRVP